MADKSSLAQYLPAVTFGTALDVVKRIADGETLLQCCEDMGLTTIQFRALCKREPMLQELYDEAQEAHDEILADKLEHIDKVVSDPKMANVFSTNYRFLLERRRPTKYGKIAENTNPDADVNRMLAAALAMAMDRIPTARAASAVTDVVFEDVIKKAAPVLPEPQSIRSGGLDSAGVARDGLAELRRLGLI